MSPRRVDATTVSPPGSPNHCLALPPGVGLAKPQVVSPVFAVPPTALALAWQRVVERAPRTEIVEVSADGLSVEAIQRMPLIGFVDRISARAVALAGGGASLAVYSRSAVGYWDLGVNRRRVEAWLADLGTVLQDGTGITRPSSRS